MVKNIGLIEVDLVWLRLNYDATASSYVSNDVQVTDMSGLEDRPTDKLAEMIYGVLWQDLLEIWRIIRKRVDSEGADAIRAAFEGAKKRFLEGPFSEHLEVRWGMNLCMHCNDDNIDKNGVSYIQPSGDGLEFNQCLNCRVGILYNLEVAKATLDSYNIGVGLAGQFAGMSVHWNALTPKEMDSFLPTYEIISGGQWKGTISFNDQLEARFLPFEAMTATTARGSEDPWTSEIPDDIQAAIEEFKVIAKEQIEVTLLFK
ncbi:MAG: hypothetical protein ACTSU3_00460 [Candidatus Thorarchaeota archaeon]